MAKTAAAVVLASAFAWSVRLNLLNAFAGRVQHVPKTNYQIYGVRNDDKCWTNPAGMACEDVKIHYPSNTAFLACGSPEDRMQFYPGAGNHAYDPNRIYQEYIIKYDIESNTTTRMDIVDWDPKNDLVLHGLDIWTLEEQKNEILIYAVNHKRTGESIVIFSHILGTSSLRFIKEISHPLIKTLNEVAAAGSSEFFVSNDHYFYSGLGRSLEERYGPFSWASSIVHCKEVSGQFSCTQVSPKNSHAYANGIILLDGGKTLAVADVVYGSISFYDVEPTTKALQLKRTTTLGASPDNLSEVPDTGDLIVAVVPNEEALYGRFLANRILDHTLPVEVAVLRLVKARGYAPEVLYWADGSLVSIMTAGAVDRGHKIMIGGGVFERHFVVCEIDY